PYLQVLALGYVATALTSSAGYLMIVSGNTRLSVTTLWARVVAFILLLLLLLDGSSALDVATLRLAVELGGVGFIFFMLLRCIDFLSWRDLFAAAYRPLAATAAMVAVLIEAEAGLPDSALLSVVAKVALGAGCFIVVDALLWLLARRPPGAEAYLLDRVRGLGRRRGG
ncbi:MAG: hypothetical protein RLW62_18290, partial [Gammaproteobacteria bacterium]